MKLTWEPLTLDLHVPFRVAHGASRQRFNLLIHLDEGVGEAPAVPYYGETPEGIITYLKSVPDLGDGMDLEAALARRPPGSLAARAALDGALHDLWGHRLGQPLYRLWGLNPEKIPPTSFTIGLDEPSVMAAQARSSGHPILKIKLGGPQDEQVLRAVREATTAVLRVDVNAGWSREQALLLLPLAQELGVELIEQPLAIEDFEGYLWLQQKKQALGLSIPIFADESVQNSRDVVRWAPVLDGVVVKTMKCGGLREALRTIHTARAFDLRVMLSCMVESSVGVTAAAHLAPLCDFVDLDGPLLITNDPFEGLKYEGARLRLPSGPGVGLKRIR